MLALELLLPAELISGLVGFPRGGKLEVLLDFWICWCTSVCGSNRSMDTQKIRCTHKFATIHFPNLLPKCYYLCLLSTLAHTRPPE